MTAIETHGRWFGPAEQSAFGWITAPADGTGGSGVVVIGPAGYAWWSSYQTMRLVAERLAAAGHTVLRLHVHGQGNAAGTQWAGDAAAASREGLRAAADELRALGCDQLTLVGAGLGGSLALEMAGETGADAVAVWQPVIAGRREARGVRMRGIAVPEDQPAGGYLSLGGSAFGPELLAWISAIDLTALTTAPGRSLVVEDPAADGAGAGEPLVARLSELGAAVSHVSAEGAQALTVPAEDAVPATEVVDAIAAFVGEGARSSVALVVRTAPGDLEWEGMALRERVVRLGEEGLVGIATEPAAGVQQPGTVVFLNSGSDPHVGAGRAWVEFARGLAATGRRALRIDFRGWGESPDGGRAPGRPYDAHCVADAAEIVAALRGRGEGPVALVGLCAGAWIALRATLECPADAVVALNPQLYWQPGDPVEALMTETRRRRTAEREAEEEGRRSGRWDAEDRAGRRTPVGDWLDALTAGPTSVSMVFAQGDDGLEYLRNRVALRLKAAIESGRVRVDEVAGIDHAMHRAWLRPQMLAAIRRSLQRAGM
jgi:alpha-beta hydrolase superfamily lysophospholipase